MVNLTTIQLSALFAYDLKSVAYKPIPSFSNGTSVGPGNINFSQVSGGSTSPAGLSEYAAQRPWKSTHQTNNGSTSGNVTSASTSNCYVAPYDAPPIDYQEFPPYDQTTANVYRYRQQQSVNLGSWFVHENWMTPSIFKCAADPQVAEIDIAKGWGSVESARSVLEHHWDTFITESDFQYLANIGINTVRLPIGYWNLGPDFMNGTAFESVAEVYTNCWPRILRAINHAGKYGIGVLVDLHGAVGSQNGQPHSGISDGETNLFNDTTNMDKTTTVLTYITEQLASVNNVVGLQLLNEPVFSENLIDFYTQTITILRDTTPNARTMPFYLHDGFDMERFSDFVSNRTDFVVQDHHSYFVFSPADQQELASQHTVDVEGAIAQSLRAASKKQHRNLVVDEWSCALSPQSLENDGNVTQVRQKFCTDQMKVYTNATAGWSFWAYKKEDCVTDPGWCFTAAVGKSLPHNFFTYKNSGSKHGSQRATNGVSDDLIIPTISTSLLNLIGGRPQSNRFFRPNLAHRFESIHYRRDTSNNSSSDSMNNSITKGYTDGFTTAQVFANNNMSRCGFTGQFILDAIKVAGPTLIAEGTEKGYHNGFMKGLQEGENIVNTS